MNENKQMIAITSFIKQKVIKYEYLLLSLIILAVWLKYMNVEHNELISTIVLSATAIIYFLSSFATHHEDNLQPVELFLFKLCSLASAVSLIGILFNFLDFPKAEPMIVVSFITLAASLIFLLFQKNQTGDLKLLNKAFLFRMAVLVIISGVLLAKEMGYIS